MIASRENETQSLLEFCRRRWSLPVIVEVYGWDGVGVATLGHRFWNASRSGLRATLDNLVDQALVTRRARAKYALTARGEHVARCGAQLLLRLRRIGAEDAALRKWSLATMLALDPGGRRFNELKQDLPGITNRSLSTTLKAMQTRSLVERTVFPTYAPRTYYWLTPGARRLIPLVTQLQMRVCPPDLPSNGPTR